jgi:AbrB family looped-hinge helix DNA binding protein
VEEVERMPTITVSSKGQVVLPREIRERHNITKGTQLEILDLGGEIILVRLPDDPLRSLRGMFRAKRPVEEMRAWGKEEDRELSERKPGRA